MDASRPILAMFSLVAGVVSAALGALWLAMGGPSVPAFSSSLTDTIANFDSLIRVRFFSATFDVLLPFVSFLSIAAGFSAWGNPASKVGAILSLFGLTIYFYAIQDAITALVR